MRSIRKDQISILKRRQKFLQDRVDRLGDYRGDTYDKNEIEALKTSVWLMEFVKDHPSVESKIKIEESYDEIMGEE